ncbi:(Fe-S)-binding protein [Propionicicella superfundia]|uniref:(Fe-S)-binding protein n=1 Tax=Propionicicella superfundia TaxID=348582 RepID=UPI00048B378C|nr:(Fe-S)-binding protein [Propionicicella superfundia]
MGIVLLVVALVATVVGLGLFVRGIVVIVRRIAVGRPSPGRLVPVGTRLRTALAEIVSHSRFRTRPVAKVAHWFVMMSFVLLVPTLGSAYAQTLDPLAELPVIGGWAPWQWIVELFAWAGLLGIVALVVLRVRYHHAPEDADTARDWRSRFFGSTRWQAYFVEAVIALVVVCVLGMHTLQSALLRSDPATAAEGGWQHYPTTAWLGTAFLGAPASALGTGIALFATAKILVSMTWMGVVGASASMSVAWHRFLAVLNVYARREADGGPALGAAAPMLVDGKPFDIRELDDLPEDASFGVGTARDLDWKSLLDFSSCSECGRCQDVCPAWNTGKPLSPKLFTLALRDHTAAVAPALRSGDAKVPTAAHTADVLGALVAAKAAASTGVLTEPGDLVPGVIDADVLWACTTCGACVEQCPVDIEHVDHILDLRRHEVMVKSEFPEEFGPLFGNLDAKGNPWGLPPRGRLEWTRGLEFPVPVVGTDVDSLAEVDYLLWVGCAGAYDDKGKQTTRAVAELLHLAGVTFAVLGDAETCSGDPARRAGNEATYQMLATQNIETFDALGVDRIIVTCAHCYNTLSREYQQLGGTYRVSHHTQVLNSLIREGRLTMAPPEESERRSVTYHDPCYLGRHNQEYEAPRELLASLPETTLVEMSHSRSVSMCCGGGGARMWTEETSGTRISEARLGEAAETGAETVATACPYCTIMLNDAAAGQEQAPAVRDVALLVLDGVRRGMAQTS